jgi:hypothetical protein
MNRRRFLPMLGSSLFLGGCDNRETAVRRFRVIATAEVDGKPAEASNVMEIHYSRLKNSLIGAGVSTRLYGEALIFDIKGKGTIFILPYRHWGTLAELRAWNSRGSRHQERHWINVGPRL